MKELIDNDISILSQKLHDLEQKKRFINDHVVTRNKSKNVQWGGAGIIICFEKPENYSRSDIIVCSSLARVIARTLNELRNVLNSINYNNKYEFYGRIAENLLLLDDNIKLSKFETLKAMYCSAQDILLEWKNSTE